MSPQRRNQAPKRRVTDFPWTLRHRIAALGLALAVTAAAGADRLQAQSTPPPTLKAGANVNIGGGPLKLVTDSAGGILELYGDPLQRQSEPSMACSPHNPQMCVAAANDTRLVKLPGVVSGKVTADAWLGVFWTTNGGKTWTSKLIPGFPRDASPEGLASPLLGKQASADPTVRAGVRVNSNGTSDALFYVSGIAFNRDDITEVKAASAGSEGKRGVSYVAVYRDSRDATVAPIYEGTFIVDNGASGQFLDKTWIDVDLPRSGESCGRVIYGQTIFTGNGTNNPSKLYITSSKDCARTWAMPTKLSEGTSTVQSANVAFNLKTGDAYVTWRVFAKSNLSDTGKVMFSKSTNANLKNWTVPVVIKDYGLWNASTAPDQISMPTPPTEPDFVNYRMFRTNAYPMMCATTDGVIRIVYSERIAGNPPGRTAPESYARIMVAKSTDNGVTWTKTPIDTAPTLMGNQLMPAIACNTRAVVAWYDQRNDSAPNAFTWGFMDFLLFGRLIWDAIPPPPTHTLDVRMAKTESNGEFGPSIQVSRYPYGWINDGSGNPTVFQTKNNVVNWPQYGNLPFIGDYIDVAVDRRIVPNGAGGWRAFGLTSAGAPVESERAEALGAHVVWTDNRDIVPSYFDRENPNPQAVEPAGAWTTVTESGQEIENWQLPGAPGCTVDGPPTANKNQNVYTSYVSDGLVVGELEESQTSGAVRAYAVFVKNTTNVNRTFKVETDNGSLSYNATVTSKLLDIPANNTRAVSVILTVEGSDPPPRTTVKVTEQAPDPGGLTKSIVLTPGNATTESHTVLLDVHPFSFTVTNPIFDPDNPIFDPDNPIFDPDNPIFDPDNPIFDPDNPIFDPDNPIFDPDNPIFDPDNPIFDPDNPIFDPDNPIFDPDNPIFDPDNPIFDPDSNTPTVYDKEQVTQITATIANDGTVSGGYDIDTLLTGLPANVIWQLVVARLAPGVRTLPGENQCNIYNLPRTEAVTNIGGVSTGTGVTMNTSTTLASGEKALLLIRIYHDGETGLPLPGTQGDTWLKQNLSITVESQAEPPGACDTTTCDHYGNTAPVAGNDSYNVNEDNTLTKNAAQGVLGNDSDENNDSLAAVLVAGPSHGTLTLNADGSFSYTPAANYNGPDSFTYKASDGSKDSNVATVDITVNSVNDAPVAVNDGTYNATEDTALVVASAQGVLVNDTDIDSSSLTAALVAGPSHGDVTLNSNGSFTYTPASNYSGTDSFTYRASDGSLTSDIATVSISVGAVNDAPTANADIKTTPRNIALTFPAGDLLANDSDAEGSALSLTAVGNAVSGTVVLNGGQITFTPAANFTGNASFKYTVCDVQSACSQGNVTVNVTQAYSFGAISFPSSGNQGSVLPLVWSYSLNNQPVNTSSLVPQVRVRALTSCQNGTETGDFVVNTKTPGNSDFQYSTTTNQWKYNWQTKLFAANTCYNVYIRLLAADGVTILQEDGPFKIQLKASK